MDSERAGLPIVMDGSKTIVPKPKSQTEQNICNYAEVFELCLREAQAIALDSPLFELDQELDKGNKYRHAVIDLAEVFFNRFYNDQNEIRSQTTRGKQDPAMVEMMQRLMHRI